MPEVKLNSLFPGSWGILSEAKDNVINSGFGGRAKAERLQMQKYFLTATQAADIAGISIKWINRRIINRVRFIMDGGKMLYFKEDVAVFTEKNNQELLEAKKREEERKSI